MTNAVIVSTARTPLAKSWKGAFNMTHGATLGGHAVQARGAARRHRRRRRRRRDHGLRQSRRRHRRQHRAPDRADGRPADHRVGRDRQPLLLLGPADHRHGRPARDRRRRRCVRGRRRGKHLLRAAGNEHAHDDATPSWTRRSPRSTGPCCRPPSRSPSATTSAATRWTSTARPASRRPAPRRPKAGSTTRSRRSPCKAGVADPVMGLRTKEVTVSKDEGTARRHDQGRHQRHQARRCRAA